MICNGFDSDNYRYFRNINDGKIVKYSQSEMLEFLFNLNFRFNRVLFGDYKVKPFPSNQPLDIIEWLKMQEPLVFKYSEIVDLRLNENDFLVVTDWLEPKLNSDKYLFSLVSGLRTIKEDNEQKLEEIDDDEVIDINFPSNSSLDTNSLRKVPAKINEAYHFNRGISFKLPFQEGEVLPLFDMSVACLFLNQHFLTTMYNSEEILGAEKEQIFEAEYQDNIPNTSIRYYELKDDFRITSIYDLTGLYNPTDPVHNFDSGNLAYLKINYCPHNPNNYREDGTIRYFYFELPDNHQDREKEEEILKIATRLPQEVALKRYKEDLEAYEKHLRNEAALEYVKKHQSRYKKGANRNLTPLEFMEQEEKREKEALQRRLIRVLNNYYNTKR